MPTAACSWAKKALTNNFVGYVDSAASASYPVNNIGSLHHIIGPIQANGVNGRLGNTIKNLRLEVHGFIYGDSTAKLNYCVFDLVYDRRPTDTLPTVADIFTVANPEGMVNVLNAGRFDILATKQLVLNGTPANEQLDNSAKKVDWVFNLDCKSMFEGTNGNIADYSQGSLLLVKRGTGSSGTTDAELQISTRLYFQDV